MINDLYEEELYSTLYRKDALKYLNGFIYHVDQKDYLCSLSSNNKITIWDLYDKKILNSYDYKGLRLDYIIDWNPNIFIIANDKGFEIFDVKTINLTSIDKGQNQKVICLKKIYHPIYGELLFSASEDGKIKIMRIE